VIEGFGRALNMSFSPLQTFSLWRFRRALNMSFSLREKVAEGRMRGG
jgi:hypothetical protein